MKLYIWAAVFVLCAAIITAQDVTTTSPAKKQVKRPLFSWDLLWAGSWEEHKTFRGRGDFRIGVSTVGLLARTQGMYKTPMIPRRDSPFGDAADRHAAFSGGLYHTVSGSRLLYGVLDEWGLPSRIRSPWLRSSPFSENHQPVITDLKTAISEKNDAVSLYLSTPALKLSGGGTGDGNTFFGGLIPVRIRGFGLAGVTVGKTGNDSTGGGADGAVVWKPALSFSGGIETFFGEKTELLMEGFYTGSELRPLSADSWFIAPIPFPARTFRLGAASLLFHSPFFSISANWAWSQAFASGDGFYSGGGIRFSPPSVWTGEQAWTKPGPFSISLAADGIGGRYIGRDSLFSDAGFRAAGKVEWRGMRSSLFRFDTVLRQTNDGISGISDGGGIERSSMGVYYRLPAARQDSFYFPIRLNRISFDVDRNAEDIQKIRDCFTGGFGLSVALPPMRLPGIFLPAAQRPPVTAKAKSSKPKMYPLGIILSAQAAVLGSASETPPPYPFVLPQRSFDSAKAGCELLWSPGVFQFRTKWAWETRAEKDDLWEASISAAMRFKHGRFTIKAVSADFPEQWACTLSWRLQK